MTTQKEKGNMDNVSDILRKAEIMKAEIKNLQKQRCGRAEMIRTFLKISPLTEFRHHCGKDGHEFISLSQQCVKVFISDAAIVTK